MDEMRQAITSAKKIQKDAIESRIMAICADSDMPMCKICLEEQGELISPCGCRGTAKWVHRDCLTRWRLRYHPSSPRYQRCMDCRSLYDTAVTDDEIILQYEEEVNLEGSDGRRGGTSLCACLTFLWTILMLFSNICWVMTVIFIPREVFEDQTDVHHVSIATSYMNSFNCILIPILTETDVSKVHIISLTLLMFVCSTSFLFDLRYSFIICVITTMFPCFAQYIHRVIEAYPIMERENELRRTNAAAMTNAA